MMMGEGSEDMRPKLGVFKFASCDGCQLQLIGLVEESSLLSTLSQNVNIAHFPEVGPIEVEGSYDVAIVEGSISTSADQQRIIQIRDRSHFLVSIGACATTGGIQALRNWRDQEEIMRSVYAHPEYIDSLKDSTAIADHVHVDFELRGCPINRDQLREVLTAFLRGKQPRTPTYSVCMECKRRGSVCVTVVRGEPCLGPVTQAGCGAICPAYDRGCYGCFGPMEQPNAAAQARLMRRDGMSPSQIVDAFRPFSHTLESEDVAEGRGES